MMTEIVQGSLFDYTTLDNATRVFVQEKTAEIKVLVKRSAQDIVEIGSKLTEVKNRIGHGGFGSWLKSEFDWSQDTASRFVRVYDKFRNLRNLESFAPSALYLLSDSSTPSVVIQEAVSIAGNGESVTHKVVKQIIEKFKALNEDADVVMAAISGTVNKRDITAARKLKEDSPSLFEKVAAGEETIKSAKREIKTQARIDEIATATLAALPATVTLYHSDFREQCQQIPDNSIDFILTDPPYPAEFLPLWEALAELANRILKPGGYLFAYSGQTFLPEIYTMLGKHLSYQWTAAVQHKQGYTRIWKHDTLNAWKPVLIYSKGEPHQTLRGMVDMIGTGQGNKDEHEWSQPESEAAYYIEYMTLPGQTILDPMMGSGTVITAAHKLNRLVIGCEIDDQHYKTVRSKF